MAGELDKGIGEDGGVEAECNEGREGVGSGQSRMKVVERFLEMGLDARVLRGLERMRFLKPTMVQSAVIPAALTGRDVLAAAPTGSGKTAAYVIPMVEVLLGRCGASGERSVLGMVVVPSRELAHQVTGVVRAFLESVGDQLHVVEVDAETSSIAAEVVVGTPASLVGLSETVHDIYRGLVFVVVDEADLVLSYGYEDETRKLLALVPTAAQSMLVSATLDDDVMALKKIVLRRPEIVKISIDDVQGESGSADHRFLRIREAQDKYLIIYVMLRLGVITGKIILFANSVEVAFRLKLFLDQFSITSVVLNADLPINSRIHCIDQFNIGSFNILIATDDTIQEDQESNGGRTQAEKLPKRRKKLPSGDRHYGVMRGLDFRDVGTVVHFEVPRSAKVYLHRSGRTARAGQQGSVLTFCCTDEEEAQLQKFATRWGFSIPPLGFRMDHIESFRYRVEDCLRSVSRAKIREARLRDVKQEMLNSNKLKSFFKENPEDLQALRHDQSLSKDIKPHLSHVPTYMLPPPLRSEANRVERQQAAKRRRDGKYFRRISKRGPPNRDPLKTFEAEPRTMRERT